MDRKQLNQATAETPSPPPGYIYSEVAKWSHNNPAVNRKLETYLMGRLKKQNPFVKWKVLLIIKHVCPKANVGFRRAMQRHTDTIKACMQIRGPPHATLGDTPYENVRTEARAAVEAIFADTQQQQSVTSGLSARIQGQGSTGGGSGSQNTHEAFQGSGGRYSTPMSHAGGGGRYNNSAGGSSQIGAPGTAGAGSYRGTAGRAMGGIGNPNFKDPRNKKPGFFDKMKSAVQSSIAGGSNNGAQNRPQFMNQPTGAAGYNYATNRGPTAVGSSEKYGAPSTSGAGSSSSLGYSNSGSAPARRNSKTRQRGGVGGGWGDSNNDSVKLNAGNRNQQAIASQRNSGPGGTSQGSQSGNIGRAGAATGDGKYEAQLVDNICSPGGLRPRPPASEVSAFVQRCKTLNAEMVASVLVDRVCSEDWTVQAKALVVVNALANDPACGAHADYFYDNKDVFEEEMEESEQKMVRDRARKVLISLGVEGLKQSSEVKSRKARKAAALPEIEAPDPDPMIDLSGANDNGSSETPVGAASDAPADDLLGMFDISSDAAGAAAPAAPAAPAAASTAAPVSEQPDLFSGLSANTTAAQTNFAPQDTQPTPTGSILDSFLEPTPSSNGPNLGSSADAPLIPSKSPKPDTQKNGNVSSRVQITDAFAGLSGNMDGSGLGSAKSDASIADPLAGLSGISTRKPQATGSAGLMNLDFSSGGASVATTQQKQNQGMQRILLAQQQQQMQMQQMQRQRMMMMMRQQQGGMQMNNQMMANMSMSGMGGVRAMPSNGQSAASTLPDFNNSQRNNNSAAKTPQPQSQQKSQSTAFGFVNDLM